MNAIFIRIEDTFEKAMSYRNGEQMQFYNFNGVQLLSGQNIPYIQKTACSEGVLIEDFVVSAYSMCRNFLGDVTESFEVKETFQDENTGLWQLYWSLTNAPDFGEQLIYLQIETGSNGYYYTSPFMLTSEGSNSVQNFYYRNDELKPMQTIGLQMYYRQDSDITTLETYTTVAGNRQIQQRLDIVEFEIYQTKVIDYLVLKQFKRLNTFRYRYMNLNPFNLIEAYETKEFENNENFVQTLVKVQRDFNPLNAYNPFYVPPAPPPPPPYQIILNNVNSVNANQVQYYFEIFGFSPTYLTYQFSLDQVSISDSTGDAGIELEDGSFMSSPITVLNNQTDDYFYRIYSPEYDVYSDWVQISPPQIVLNSVYTPDGFFNQLGNKYFFDFDLLNFNPTSQLIFESSINGTIWDTGSFLLYGSGNNSPKAVSTGSSNQERKYFRIRYISQNLQLQLTSNVAFHEF